MRKNKINLIIGCFSIFTFLGLAMPVSAGFEQMPISGDGKVKLTVAIDDTKNITDYSGVEHVRYRDSYNGINGQWTPWVQVTNKAATPLTPINKGNITHPTTTLQSWEGIHTICTQVKDHADTVHGLGTTAGNETDGTGNISREVCRDIFLDKTPPLGDSVVLNKGNHWINTGNVPVEMTITDNRAGLASISYDNGFGSRTQVPPGDISCTQDTNVITGTGKWTCKVKTTLVTNVNRTSGNMGIQLCDRVGHCQTLTKCIGSLNDSCVMKYDKVLPEASVEIKNFNGGANGDKANVDIHVQDLPNATWTQSSGLETIKISNPDGSNERLIWDAINQPNPPSTFDDFIRDYTTNACPSSVKLTVQDKAGNITVKNSDPKECTIVSVKQLEVINVVNPKIYNLGNPFSPRAWDFISMPQKLGTTALTAQNPFGDLPKATAGGNITFSFGFDWTGDPNFEIDAYYTVKTYNTTEGFERVFTNRLTRSDFVSKGSGLYELKPQTFAVPKNAPSSKGVGKTYVAISVTVDLTTLEGGAQKTQTTYFTNDDPTGDGYGRIAEVVAGMDDYLWFGETN